MNPPNPQELFRQSLARCKQRDDFLDRFYERFMASSDEVRQKFVDTDFTQQKKRMIESLAVAADVIDGDAAAMRHLHQRAASHSNRELDIRPALYDYWLEALLATAEECDPDFTAEIGDAWRKVLGHIIGYMRAHYRQS